MLSEASMRSFQVRHRNQRLLERQRQEAEAGWFQYQLERDRCQNLIVFLLFLLDRKEEAVVLCEKLLAGNETSIITLTSLAVLQWETGRREDSYKTIRVLQALRDAPNFQYLQAVAVAEKGYVFISHGPKYFLKAIDMFEEAIAKSPDGSDVYLWKYDLALAIRRNFNVFAYAEHSRLSAPWLARRAVELLNDTSTHCPNGLYRARSLVELASLVSAINSFKRVCREADRREIAQLRLDDHMSILRQALDTPEGQEDSYVLRVAGRFYGMAKQFDTAIDCLLKSRQKRDEGIVNQLLAKTTLSHYKWKRHRGGARSQDRGRQSFGRSPGRGRSGWGRSGRGYRGGRGGGAYAQSSFQPQERQQSGGGWRREEPRGFTSSRDNPLRKLLKSAAEIYDHYDPEDPDVKQAEFFYIRALECDPYNHGAVYDTGLLYQGMDKPEMALGYFQQTVASSDPLIGSLQVAL
nr:hypothetical protein BaRGS_014020 [Batillaria attramentaria]